MTIISCLVIAVIALLLVVPTCGFHRRDSVRSRPEFIDLDRYFQWRCGGVSTVSGPYDDFIGIFKYEPTIVPHATNNMASLAGYRSAHYAPWLVIDMDGPEAFEQSKTLWRFLIESLPIPMEAILIFFSGNRGIHFYVDMRVIGSEPSELFFRYLKMFCSRLATDAGVVIDMAVYGPLQVVRSPNAKHAGSGLYKICLSPTELQEMRREEILEIAQQPRYFDLSMQTINVLPELTKRWSEGVETVDRAENERKSRVMIDSTASSNMFSPMMSSGSTSNHPLLSYPSLHSQTLDFIKLGAPVGTRHSRLVAATKNFADFGPGAKGLAYALLYPAAFMSGLPNDEICKVLEWAFK